LLFFSFITSSFTLLTRCMVARKPQASSHHRIIPFMTRHDLWFGFCVWMVTTVLCLGFVLQPDDAAKVNCKNNSESYLMTDGGFCIFQGLFMYYFLLAACYCKIVLSIDLRAVMKGESHPFPEHLSTPAPFAPTHHRRRVRRYQNSRSVMSLSPTSKSNNEKSPKGITEFPTKKNDHNDDGSSNITKQTIESRSRKSLPGII